MGNIYLDVAALQRYAANPEPPPGGKTAALILQEVWNSLVQAKVLVSFYIDDDGNEVNETPDGQILVDAQHDLVAFKHHAGGPNTVWDGEKLPPTEGLIHALGYALVTIFNSPPADGPRPWPKN